MHTVFEKLDRYFLSKWRMAVLDPYKGIWIIDAKTESIPYLKAENANGRHILIQPEDSSHFLLADDLSDQMLSAHHKFANGSFKPGRMVVETSPHNFQVWIHSRNPLTLDQKRIVLKKLKSDPGADPSNRFGRCPGFRNRKEKHQSPNGLFPLARLIWIDWKQTALIPSSFYDLPIAATRPACLSHQPLQGGVCQCFARNTYQKGNESETDFAYTLALIRKGLSDDQIRSCILSERINWYNHQGEKRQIQYLNRTIRRAREISRKTV